MSNTFLDTVIKSLETFLERYAGDLTDSQRLALTPPALAAVSPEARLASDLEAFLDSVLPACTSKAKKLKSAIYVLVAYKHQLHPEVSNKTYAAYLASSLVPGSRPKACDCRGAELSAGDLICHLNSRVGVLYVQRISGLKVVATPWRDTRPKPTEYRMMPWDILKVVLPSIEGA